jgi:hypothetical protein
MTPAQLFDLFEIPVDEGELLRFGPTLQLSLARDS